MTKRAVLYARVSGDDRSRTEGRNIAGQLEMTRDYALRKGYKIVAELAEDDRGASGASFELPQLSRLLEMAHAGEVDIVVVRELDRLSRDLAKQLIVEQELSQAGVKIEYVLYDFPDTPEGRLNKNLRAMLAEYEREKICQRMIRGRRQRVKSGNVMFHGHTPYGYREVEQDGKTILEVDQEEAEIVKMIFQWYLFGDGESKPLGTIKIATKLTEMGVLTFTDKCERNVKKKKRACGSWTHVTVFGMLRNETYTGVWHYGATDIEVKVPAIIDRETWEAVQHRLPRNKLDAKRNTKHNYLMRRRLTCGWCGLKMSGKSRWSKPGGKLYLYYRCPGNHHGMYAHDCDLPSFRAEQVDKAAWQWLTVILEDPDCLLNGLEEQKERQEKANEPLWQRVRAIDQLLSDRRRELSKLLDLYITGDFPVDMLTERRDRLESVIEKLEAEKREVLAMINMQPLTDAEITEIRDLAAQIREELDITGADQEVKRQLVELFDVRGTLLIEEGERIARFSCRLEDLTWSTVLDSIVPGRSSTHRSCQ